jgi:hypothetical protein
LFSQILVKGFEENFWKDHKLGLCCMILVFEVSFKLCDKMDWWIWNLFRKIRKKLFSCSWATRRTQFRKNLFRVSKRVGYTIEYRYELTNVVRVSNEEKLCRIALLPHLAVAIISVRGIEFRKLFRGKLFPMIIV